MKTMQEKMATAVLAAMISMNFAVVCSADESSITNRLNTATSASLSAFTMDAATATTYWSLGHVPRAGEHAYSEVNCYVIKSDEKLTFAGDSLTLAGSAVLQMNAWFNVGTLHLGAGTSVRSASSNSDVYGDTASGSGIGLTSAQVLSGDAIWIKGTDASPTLFAIAQDRRLVVASPLRGTGTVRAQTHTASGYLRGAIAFTANSSQFAGRFVVSSRGGSKATPDPSTGKILQFYMTAAGNVGGAMPEFTYNGFTVENDSLVNGRNELTFDELTRGILIEKRARFVMTTENNRLTFNAPVTYHGELVFGNDYPTAIDAPTGPGGGDLVLGAGAMFLSNNSVTDMPIIGGVSNKLLMVVGRVKPTVTNALDGVAVMFGADSGGLLLDINPSGDGMAEYGLVNAKWDVPFTIQRADGKIPVAFEGMESGRLEGDGFARGICTVNAVAAASLDENTFDVEAPYRNVKVKVERKVNADTTVTFKVVLSKMGFQIRFR